MDSVQVRKLVQNGKPNKEVFGEMDVFYHLENINS